MVFRLKRSCVLTAALDTSSLALGAIEDPAPEGRLAVAGSRVAAGAVGKGVSTGVAGTFDGSGFARRRQADTVNTIKPAMPRHTTERNVFTQSLWIEKGGIFKHCFRQVNSNPDPPVGSP